MMMMMLLKIHCHEIKRINYVTGVNEIEIITVDTIAQKRVIHAIQTNIGEIIPARKVYREPRNHRSKASSA